MLHLVYNRIQRINVEIVKPQHNFLINWSPLNFPSYPNYNVYQVKRDCRDYSIEWFAHTTSCWCFQVIVSVLWFMHVWYTRIILKTLKARHTDIFNNRSSCKHLFEKSKFVLIIFMPHLIPIVSSVFSNIRKDSYP